jgi:hypothetical protein
MSGRLVGLLVNPRGILAERRPDSSATGLAALNFPWLFAQNVTVCGPFPAPESAFAHATLVGKGQKQTIEDGGRSGRI